MQTEAAVVDDATTDDASSEQVFPLGMWLLSASTTQQRIPAVSAALGIAACVSTVLSDPVTYPPATNAEKMLV